MSPNATMKNVLYDESIYININNNNNNKIYGASKICWAMCDHLCHTYSITKGNGQPL